jgi:hypothetical protein
MNRFVSLTIAGCALLAALPAAGETWNFVYVARSTDWQVRTGLGELARKDARFEGVLRDTQGVEYRIAGSLAAKRASARFVAVASDDAGTELMGTFNQWSPAQGNFCWETVQLYDGWNYVGLSRNLDGACKQ